MKISEIMIKNVRTAKPDDTAKSAVLIMNKFKIGSIVIADGKKPVGIITERDILTRIVAEGKNSEIVTCRQIMSKPLVVIDENDDTADAIELMAKEKIKKLVVMKDGELAGIITATDILKSGEQIEEAVLNKLARILPIAKAPVHFGD